MPKFAEPGGSENSSARAGSVRGTHGAGVGKENFAALQKEIGVQAGYHMTEVQADAVVRLQLGQLAALERDEIFKEFNQLRQEIHGYEELLANEKRIRDLIRADLVHLRDKYSNERRTQILDEGPGRLSLEDLIAEEENTITLSHNGYIKRLPINTYRSQHRGGKGVSGGDTREDDFIEHFFTASTHAYLLCFTNRGQMYWLKVYEIPQMSRTSAGRAIANVLSLREEEKITSVIAVRHFDADKHLLMATRRGIVKKTPLEQYNRPRTGGIIGIALKEGDQLIDVALTQPGDEVVLATKMGQAIRFDTADARAMGRNTSGVKGISLAEGDEVVGMVVTDPEGALLTVCANGYGKRTPFGPNTAGEPEGEGEEAPKPLGEPSSPAGEAPGEAPEEGSEETASDYRYRKQRRGGQGVKNIRTSERNGEVVGIASVRDDDDIMLITTQGMVNRTHVSEIRLIGRRTQGVRIMDLSEGDKIASIAKVAREAEGEDGAEETGEAGPTTPPEEQEPNAEE